MPGKPITVDVMVEYVHRDQDGKFYIDVRANGEPLWPLGPFDTARERKAVLEDLLKMTRSLGAKDMPAATQ